MHLMDGHEATGKKKGKNNKIKRKRQRKKWTRKPDPFSPFVLKEQALRC